MDTGPSGVAWGQVAPIAGALEVRSVRSIEKVRCRSSDCAYSSGGRVACPSTEAKPSTYGKKAVSAPPVPSIEHFVARHCRDGCVHDFVCLLSLTYSGWPGLFVLYEGDALSTLNP